MSAERDSIKVERCAGRNSTGGGGQGNGREGSRVSNYIDV